MGRSSLCALFVLGLWRDFAARYVPGVAQLVGSMADGEDLSNFELPHYLMLMEDGSVRGWGSDDKGQVRRWFVHGAGSFRAAEDVWHQHCQLFFRLLKLWPWWRVVGCTKCLHQHCDVQPALQVSGPASLPKGSVKSMAAGPGHSLLLLTNGSLAAYGSNTFGQVRYVTCLL
jgi:alpha-tubulin suppressor-like RCC1 family protein